MSELHLLVKRVANNTDKGYVIGHLYYRLGNATKWSYFCDTIEDQDRGLDSTMNLTRIKYFKKYGTTAIPIGTYKLKWDYSPKFKRMMPHVCNVPGYEGIRIHAGNTDKDTLGCLLLGENKVVGKVINSKKWCEEFDNRFRDFTNIDITYIRTYAV